MSEGKSIFDIQMPKTHMEMVVRALTVGGKMIIHNASVSPENGKRPLLLAYRRGAIALAVSAALAPLAYGQATPIALDEIVVTAQKRSANLQDVPVAVSALDNKALNELNVSNFEDYVRFQPNVVAAGNGPGQSAFFIRGMATNLGDIGVSEISGASPNVALYLDEQPISTISRNLDVYVTDLERIEVLAGPQGTLFGASSQAGTIRLITKKPVQNETEAGVDVSFSSTAHGEASNSVEGYVNLPLIEDKLALRVAAYNASRGGYIDNVLAEITLPANNTGILNGAFLSRLQDPDVIFTSVSNSALVEKDFNDARYQGFRVSGHYIVNDNWSLLVQHAHQRLETEGVFSDDPVGDGGVLTDDLDGAGEYAVARFYPDDLDDVFSQTSLTLDGRIGALDVLYTGAYLDRDVQQRFDYAGYIDDAAYVAYYICDYYAPTTRAPVCYDATYGSNMDVRFTRNTHEFRVSTPEHGRVRAIGGVFYDDSESQSDIRFLQPGIFSLLAAQPQFYAPDGVPILAPFDGATNSNPNPRDPGTTFFNDVTRGEEQIAVFGEVTFDLTEHLSITGGLRYYEYDLSLGGSTVFVFGGTNIDTALAGQSPTTQDDVISKANMSWRPNDDYLFYLTYSEGFRPGGFNRNGGTGNDPASLIPFFYVSDTVENYEFGWKTSFLNDRIRFNGALYRIDWSELQLQVQDTTISQLAFVDNIGEAEITGIEGDIAFAATDNLTLYAAFSYNDTELTQLPGSVANLVPLGSNLAFTPEFQYNVRGRYGWSVTNDMDAHVQVAVQHSGESQNSIIAANSALIDSWTSVDLSAGIAKDSWRARLFVENATDERISRSKITSDPRNLQNVGRPRTIGLRLSYEF